MCLCKPSNVPAVHQELFIGRMDGRDAFRQRPGHPSGLLTSSREGKQRMAQGKLSTRHHGGRREASEGRWGVGERASVGERVASDGGES